MAERKRRPSTNPDQVPLTKLQAERLSAMTGASVKELAGVRPAELSDEIKWSIDPLHWLYRRVCGRVVKHDPITGNDYPVPNATVHVEDTDCNLILYTPINSKFSWLYPFGCRREELATVTTDECGRFCAWIPRWDIDWILTWRQRRVCFPVIFERPSLRDILEDLQPIPIPKPGPGPDPGPLRLTDLRAGVLGGAGASAGAMLGAASLSRSLSLGESTEAFDDAIAGNAFEHDLQPPLPEEFVDVISGPTRGDKDLGPLLSGALADRVGLDPKRLAGFDLRDVIGPFRRCYTEIVPTWLPVFDVPDITFRVTQDVDGDGTEETIYGESYFQVRWDAGYIPPVTLKASSWARESRICDAPPAVPCGNVPAIAFAGLMPLTAAYHDNTTGYAIRPNRPRPGGVPTSPATAPYCQNVNLFGCLPAVAGATQYRLVYRYAAKAGDPLPANPTPFTTESWYWHPTGGSPVHATLDANGWTPLPPAGVVGTVEEHFLFPFDTTAHTEGLYAVRVQLGNSGGTSIAESAEVLFTIDNRAPTILNQIRWSIDGGGSWTVLPVDCPVVRRGSVPHDVMFEVTWNVMAPAHYRDSAIDSAGCGPSGLAPVLDPSGQQTSDWHTSQLDNAITYVTTYRLGSGQAEGTYSFGCHANSRAFNPSGNLATYQATDWLSDGGAPIYNDRRINFSVING